MEIVLNNKDLQQLDKLIQDMPFKYGYPLFLILTKKIEETKLAQTIKAENGQTIIGENTTSPS
jgi:hypothetical protein